MLTLTYNEHTVQFFGQGLKYEGDFLKLKYNEKIYEKVVDAEIYFHEDLEEEIGGNASFLHLILACLKFEQNHNRSDYSLTITDQMLPSTGSEMGNFNFDELVRKKVKVSDKRPLYE